MQARLALALFLSFLVLLFMRGKNPAVVPEEGQGPAPYVETQGLAPEVGDSGEPAHAVVPLLTAQQGAEPWRETITFGPYQATLDNRGAVLCELRLDGFYTELFLEEEAKADPLYWVPLCLEVDTGREVHRSLSLMAQPSSRGWCDLDPQTALWDVELERDGAGRPPA